MGLKRIKALAMFIDQDDKIADIGCDHGYLCIEAIKKGVSFVQAIDNKHQPLSVAKKNIKKYETLTIAKYTLANGLDKLDKKVDTIVISGMGPDLIIDIIDKNIDKIKKLKKVILQANNKTYKLRKYLNDFGFIIKSEKIVEERGKIYEIIYCYYKGKIPILTLEEIHFGPILLKTKEEIFIKKWTNRLNLLKKQNYLSDQALLEKKQIEEILYGKDSKYY